MSSMGLALFEGLSVCMISGCLVCAIGMQFRLCCLNTQDVSSWFRSEAGQDL